MFQSSSCLAAGSNLFTCSPNDLAFLVSIPILLPGRMQNVISWFWPEFPGVSILILLGSRKQHPETVFLLYPAQVSIPIRLQSQLQSNIEQMFDHRFNPYPALRQDITVRAVRAGSIYPQMPRYVNEKSRVCNTHHVANAILVLKLSAISTSLSLL